MSSKVTLALVGIGGFGSFYASSLLDQAEQHGVRLIAAVDPYPTSFKRLPELRARQVPLYPSLEAMYARHQPDMVAVCSPIHLHSEHVIEALNHGSHVLCEKPACSTVGQVRQMIDARDRAGKIVGIGYQWSFCPSIQRLKADVAAGAFGEPRRLRSLVLWPRSESYYTRNRWAGRRKDELGRPVFDSPVANACAHYLHNMLYVLGNRVDRSAVPARVQAELYRAQPIENYDTASLRCWTDQGVEILFTVSHSTREDRGPLLSYEFEDATVEVAGQGDGDLTARFRDGSVRNYGPPAPSTDVSKLWMTAEAVRSGGTVPCGLEAAAAQTQVMCAAQQSMPEVATFPPAVVHVEGELGRRKTTVSGLDDVLARCYHEGKLPSEVGAPWAAAGQEVVVTEWRGRGGRTPLAEVAG